MLKQLILVCLAISIWTLPLSPSIFLPIQNLEEEETADSSIYTIKYYDQQVLDHFSYTSTATYSQRYIEQVPAGWNQNTDPVFIYCGNEANIFSFYNNSGFLRDTLYKKFNARVLFLEHRYFGKSMPFGNQSYTYPNYQYLTVNQALADLVQFIRYYKQEILQCTTKVCPKFIAFGGSYGGMLAAWIRMKFPNVIDGSISSSGPILYFKGWRLPSLMFALDQTPEENYFKIITSDYTHSTKVPNCVNLIRQGYQILYQYSQNPYVSNSTLANISSAFNMCQGYQLTNYQNISSLINWLETAHSYMAMTNYPYESTFLQHLPGWPCNHSCEAFSSISNMTNISEYKLLQALYKSAETYYNYYGPQTCLNILNASASINNMNGWDYLACGMCAMPMSSQFDVDDFFPPSPWNYTLYTDYCQEAYGFTPRYDWPLDYFGGRDAEELAQYSNIFFANGRYDPWSAGGVVTNISDSVVAYYMDGAAHHLDLRTPNAQDPPQVTECRNLEMSYISKWTGKKIDDE